MGTKGNKRLEEVLLAKDSDHESQATVKTVGFLHPSFTYDPDSVFIQQGQVNEALQKYFPVACHAHLVHTSHYQTVAGHPENNV